MSVDDSNDKKHPIRKHLDTLDSVEEVRIICENNDRNNPT
jgi:hypothetical protein